jgi:hypothetical protein
VAQQRHRMSLGAPFAHFGQRPAPDGDGGGKRRIHSLRPLALTLLLVVSAVLLLWYGSTGRLLHPGTGHAVGAPPLRVARADVHAETSLNGKDLELNLAISQIQNDCQEALNGGACLRYSVVLDERPLMVGYGVVPLANVHVTAQAIALRVDTSKLPNFVHLAGQGGLIVINWRAIAAVARAGSMQRAQARGAIEPYPLPHSKVLATLLVQ